jgi:hypothetical protein
MGVSQIILKVGQPDPFSSNFLAEDFDVIFNL